MNLNLSKHIEKIFFEFNKINKLSKSIIKFGSLAFLLLFAVGTIIVVVNNSIISFEPYIQLIAHSIIKSSFIIFAESVVGGIAIDYIMGKS